MANILWANFNNLFIDPSILTGFKLSLSQSQNVSYFSLIIIPKKSHFTISKMCQTCALCYLCVKQKKTCEFHLYYQDVCKINEWCFVDCFNHKFSRVSIQIMVSNYCIAKCKKFSACRLLMALWAIFFAIQYIYINSNPV